jgi:spermidine/putrescine transport system permease protein
MRSLRARLAPYWLALPGGLWLAIFFVVPMFFMLSLSLQQGDPLNGFKQTFHWSTYVDTITLYDKQFIRSIIYALIVTVLLLLISYPMAYWIAFYGGRHKSTVLFLILLPFFVSFVIRTLSWEFLLAGNGIILGPLKDIGLLP